MSSSLVLMSPVALPESLPPTLPTPKYAIGEQVTWCHTASQDFGRIVGLVYAAEASVSATWLTDKSCLASTRIAYPKGV